MNYRKIRDQVYRTAVQAQETGLVRLSAGNFSLRTEEGLVAITPSGIRYDVLEPEDIAILDLDGTAIEAHKKPSSELPMHLAILRNLPEVRAVCHTHSPFAIAFSMLAGEIPVVNLELMACGAPVPVAPWACPGTPEAGRVTVEIFRERPGLKVSLLRSHGLVAIGSSLEQAYEYAYDAELGMQTYYYARQMGQPAPLTQAQLDQIHQVYGSG